MPDSHKSVSAQDQMWAPFMLLSGIANMVKPTQSKNALAEGNELAENLAGKTFEVQTFDGERWIVADIHNGRSVALAQAEELLGSGNHAGVRVIAESERAGTETVLEQILDEAPGKAIQIVPIQDAAYCQALDDYYGFAARRTIGRLLRAYLDEQVFSALELIFDAAQLIALERNDRLFPQAVQRVAGLHAKASGETPTHHAERIYAAFEQIKAHAREIDEAEFAATLLADGGLDAALGKINTSMSQSKRGRAMRFALARYLRKGGDWNTKLELVAGLGRRDDVPSQAALGYLDETLAELLDGAQAVKELLGGQPDLATASQTMIRLSAGRCPVPKKSISCIEAVNELFSRLELPLSRAALLGRVARELGGIRPLTREGAARDRDIFVTVVRDLVELAGLSGGPLVAEAVVRRARLVLGGDEDLSMPEAVSRVLDLLPHRAVRLGFLLDLAVSDLGRRDQTVIFGFVGRIVMQMTSISSFLPPGSSMEILHDTVDGLKQRLSADGLPESWRRGIGDALQSVSEKGVGAKTSAGAAQAAKAAYKLDEETRRIIAMTPDQEIIAQGQILFEEGDPGDQAYLIKEGEVEIVRRAGNTEHVLARLGRGDIFGEMALIDNQPRMATARVAADAELAIITRENIEARLNRVAQSDMVVRRLIDVFVARIRGEARLHE